MEITLAWGRDHNRLQASWNLGIIHLADQRSAIEIATDYFKNLYVYFLRMSDNNRFNEPVEFWLPVLTTWSPEVKAMVRNAAATAGFGSDTNDTLFLVARPDALAAAIIPTYFITRKLWLETVFWCATVVLGL
ncbi:hypothetical protein BJX70DRAFT_277216 [Aspergillus crustosus]